MANYSEVAKMNQTFYALIFTTILAGCEVSVNEKTPEMEAEARKLVMDYLEKNSLPNEGLASFESAVKPKPDYSYLYTGGGRCIEFVVLCHGNSCKELQKYPYDEHGEECP